MLGLFAVLCIVPVLTVAEGAIFVGAVLFVIFLAPFVAYIVIRHYRDDPKVKAFNDTVVDLGLGLWAIVKGIAITGLVVVGLLMAYLFWYPHKVTTLVYTNGNWMQGEKRNCTLATSPTPYRLDCTVTLREEQPHEFDVTYTGTDPADQEKGAPMQWKCIRDASSISCNK